MDGVGLVTNIGSNMQQLHVGLECDPMIQFFMIIQLLL